MTQYRCPNCDGNIRTIGTKKGTEVHCRHCTHMSFTTEDNFRDKVKKELKGE